MKKLQRYDLDNVDLSPEGFNTMVPNDMGALCWYADVVALEAENKRLIRQLELAQDDFDTISSLAPAYTVAEARIADRAFNRIQAIFNKQEKQP